MGGWVLEQGSGVRVQGSERQGMREWVKE